MVTQVGDFHRSTEQQLLNFFFTTGFFGDVVEPSNSVSAWVDQTDGWERASPTEDGEDAGDNAMAGCFGPCACGSGES